jgi:hypothetical protein
VKLRKSRYGSIRWKDQKGNRWFIEDMATSHLRNCLPFMKRNARAFVHKDADEAWNLTMYVHGEMALDQAEHMAMMLDTMVVDGSDEECIAYVRKSTAYKAMVQELWDRRRELRAGNLALDVVPK